MEKKHTFNYLFRQIFFGFIVLTGIISNVNASFFHATTLNNKNNKKQTVHFIYDWHIENPNINQAEAVVEEIAQDQKNALAIVEIHDSWTTPEMAAVAKNQPRALFCHISSELAKRNIPAINIEFRTYLTEDGKAPCMLSAPERMSVVEFVKIIQEQLALIQESKDQLLTIEDLAFWNKVIEICSQEEFDNASLAQVYDYLRNQAEDGNYPTPEEIFDKTCNLIDAKIIRYVTASDKENIFIIAGGWHLTNVREYLENHGYATMHEEGISLQEVAALHQDNQTHPEKMAQLLPQIDMQQYFKSAEFKAPMLWQPFIVT